MLDQTAIDNVRRTHYAQVARRCVFGLYGMSTAWGSLQIVFPDNGAIYLACVLLCASLATGWAVWDAKSRGMSIMPILQMLFFLIWPVGALIYLIYRSGIRGFFTAVIHAFGLVVTLAITFYATIYGLHTAGWLDSRYY